MMRKVVEVDDRDDAAQLHCLATHHGRSVAGEWGNEQRSRAQEKWSMSVR
jgi:hypothetical protein